MWRVCVCVYLFAITSVAMYGPFSPNHRLASQPKEFQDKFSVVRLQQGLASLLLGGASVLWWFFDVSVTPFQ